MHPFQLLTVGALVSVGSFSAALPMLPLRDGVRAGLDHIGGGAELPSTHLSLGPTPPAAHVPHRPNAAIRPALDDDPLALTLGSKRPAQDPMGAARYRRKTEPEELDTALKLGPGTVHEPHGVAEVPLPQMHPHGHDLTLAASSSRRPVSPFTASAASTTDRHPPGGPPAIPHGEGPSSAPTHHPSASPKFNIVSLRRQHGESKETHEDRVLAEAKVNHREWLAGRRTFHEVADSSFHKTYLQAFARVHMTHEINNFKGDPTLRRALQRTIVPRTGVYEGRSLWGLKSVEAYHRFLDETRPLTFNDRGHASRHKLAWELERLRDGKPILPFKSEANVQRAEPVESSAST